MTATIAARNTVRTHPVADPADRGRAWLARLFAGDFPFPAVPTCPLPPGERTAAEYDAVARAAGSRDLFVVHADRVGGERVIADIARATAERVLILSPDPGAADRITDRLLGCGVPVVRALADDENPVRPSPTVSKATSRARGEAEIEQPRHTAAAAVAAAEQRIEKFSVVSKAVARLTEVNDLLKELDASAADAAARRDRAEAEVAVEIERGETAFAGLVARLRAEQEAALAGRVERRVAARKAADDKEAEVCALRQQLAGSVHKSGFFTRWFGKSKPGIDADDLKKHLQTAEAELAALAAEAAARQAEVENETAAHAVECQKLIADEVAARRGLCEAELSTVESDRARAQAEVGALNKVIGEAVPGDDPVAAERDLVAARERYAKATLAEPEAIARAAAGVRVVVGTPFCLGADPVFAACNDDPPFGLLVLDRAEELPEPEFHRLARLAGRWVLIGDAAPLDHLRPSNGRIRPSRNGRPAEAPFVARVARLLDRERWAPEGDRLVCRLTHLTPEQRRSVSREPLADRPEIELRFAASDAEPVLAEIAFPGTAPIPEAKRFLFDTLGEVLLRPCGEFVWEHSPDAITAIWPAADTARDVAWIELEPGVREKVSGSGLFAYTAAVSFRVAAGWNAEKASEWIDRYLPPPAVSRFAAVPRLSAPRPG